MLCGRRNFFSQSRLPLFVVKAPNPGMYGIVIGLVGFSGYANCTFYRYIDDKP